jgi:hypothetical protein
MINLGWYKKPMCGGIPQSFSKFYRILAGTNRMRLDNPMFNYFGITSRNSEEVCDRIVFLTQPFLKILFFIS